MLRVTLAPDGSGGLTVGTPEPVLTMPHLQSTSSFPGRNWDLSPDGTRFLTVASPEGEPSSATVTAEVVVNWFTEIRALEGG